MNFIQLTLASNGKETFVNPEQILSFHTNPNVSGDITTIFFSGHKIDVSETLEDLKRIFGLNPVVRNEF